jgi:hypothetical protein
VPAARRFITGWSGQRLAKEGVPHVPFGAWPEITAHLLDADSP